VYLYYTATSPTIHNRVSRFTISGDTLTSSSELQLLNLPTLDATNHNGGAIHFGNDGKLYIAVGENAVGSNAQSLGTPLGKMLRINRDGMIPSDNPFFNSTTGISRAIWALGLRNPFTFDVQRTTGRIFINDVGQDTWEEIDDGIAGSNYGWPTTEGPTTDTRFRSPLFAYTHASTKPFAAHSRVLDTRPVETRPSTRSCPRWSALWCAPHTTARLSGSPSPPSERSTKWCTSRNTPCHNLERRSVRRLAA